MFLAIVDSVPSWVLDSWSTILIVYLVFLLIAYLVFGPRSLKEWQQLTAILYGGLAGLIACFGTGAILFYLMFQTPLFTRWWGDSTLSGIAISLITWLIGVALHFVVIGIAIYAGIWTFNYISEYIVRSFSMNAATAVAGTVFGTAVGVVVAVIAFLFIAYVAFIAIAFVAAAIAVYYGFIMLIMILIGGYVTSD